MKPAPFTYLAPGSVDDVVTLLSQYGDEARLLAGGQSLGPLLNLRLAVPSVLVDLNRVHGLDTVREDEDGLLLGAMVRQRDAELSRAVADCCPVLADALPYVAHRTIRNRGTIGGSLAHADPAAEIPSTAVALDAELMATGPAGQRIIPAESFFKGHFTTALLPDEVLLGARFRRRGPHSSSAWLEFAPRHGDFAIVGVAAVLETNDDGSITDARLVYAGIGETPKRHRSAEEVLIGRSAGAAAFGAAAEAAAEASRPPSDLIASAGYRRHLVEVLTVRALRSAWERIHRA